MISPQRVGEGLAQDRPTINVGSFRPTSSRLLREAFSHSASIERRQCTDTGPLIPPLSAGCQLITVLHKDCAVLPRRFNHDLNTVALYNNYRRLALKSDD